MSAPGDWKRMLSMRWPGMAARRALRWATGSGIGLLPVEAVSAIVRMWTTTAAFATRGAALAPMFRVSATGTAAVSPLFCVAHWYVLAATLAATSRSKRRLSTA